MSDAPRQRPFGRTGWLVSQISLGTVELGLKYGIYRPDEPELPDESRGVKRLRQALEAGIDLIDTAPGYGRAEELAGHALSQLPDPERVRVATKVSLPPPNVTDPAQEIRRSLDQSRRRLRRDRLDLVQIHNPSAADLTRSELLDPLLEARDRGWIEHLGASIYGTEAALAAIRAPELDAVQVAYNLLDRRMEREVFPLAAREGTAVLVRSALLKGVLTDRYRYLPEGLGALRRAAEAAWDWAEAIGEDLPRAAVRFCLSRPEVSSVLIGPRPGPGLDEFLRAVELASAPPLAPEEVARAEPLALDDDGAIDPRSWGIA